MESKVLSIIIPVYNAEKYIPNLMEKFVVQDLSNVEIILVDDGSKDNSLRICQEYADRNENIVVIHQENRGATPKDNCNAGWCQPQAVPWRKRIRCLAEMAEGLAVVCRCRTYGRYDG